MWQDEAAQSPRIISVSSSSKKTGKTTLSAFLIRELQADYALKVCADHHVPPIIDDPEIICKPGTDTGALVEAGARKVVWASSGTDDGLARVISKALELFPAHGIMVVESNSALKHISPDFAIFMMSVPFCEFKPSAFPALAKADLVLLDMRRGLRGRDVDEIVIGLAEQAPEACVLSYADQHGLREALRETSHMAREAVSRPLVPSLLAGEGSTQQRG